MSSRSFRRNPAAWWILVLASAGATGCAASAVAEACDEAEAPSFVTAVNIGNLDDVNGATLSQRGYASRCHPEQYYRFHAVDTSLLHRNAPSVALSYNTPGVPDGGTRAQTLELCVYIMCSAGGAQNVECTFDGQLHEPVMSGEGFPGCCRTGPGVLGLDYSCSTGVSSATSRDTADFLVHVCSEGGLESEFGVTASY